MKFILEEFAASVKPDELLGNAMTASNELKKRCREIMLTHLKRKGYPNLTIRGILNEVKPMWIALEEVGLVEEIKSYGYTFQDFENVALKKAQESAFDKWVEGLAENMTITKRKIK